MTVPSDTPAVPFSSVRRIGVFKFRNIGDVLMITPALRALREAFPAAEITVAVNSVTDAMLQGNPHINHVLVYDRTEQQRGVLRRALHEWRFFRAIRSARFDLTVDFTSGDRPARYSWFSGAPKRVAFRDWKGKWNWRNLAYTHTRLNPQTPIHEVERHLELLRFVGIVASNRDLCLLVPAQDREWAEQLLAPHRSRPIVHIHPVARWLFKCWDNSKMAEVIDWLELEKDVRTVISSSANEREASRTKDILGRCRSQPIALVGQTSLAQLAAISEQADCFFGVDTAPMHIAAAVKTPVVCLFGPTDKTVWHPWCEKQITLAKNCRCTQLRRQDCDWNGVRDCLQAITVGEAKSALEKFL